jgi:hypothetical protein
LKELAVVAKQHRYLLSQMVPAMQMVASGWTDAELDRLHKAWLQVHRAAWRLSPGFASAPFLLPEQKGGCPVAHPRVLMIHHNSALPAASRDLLPPDDGGESTPPPGAVACANYHPTESRLAGAAAESPPHG